MPAPSTTDEFLSLVAKSDLLAPQRLEEFLSRRQADQTLPNDNLKLAQFLVHDGLLTKYQAEQLLGGRWRNFIIGGKYKLLERLGKGGMALVFLCEHQVMKRLVALKILPTAHNEDKELLGRFHREARALSQLRHPNIVGAYDADQANKVHFLVMEYVDGGDLDQIVQRSGPLGWDRAAHYISQAAHGLQHAHECGLVHRDIKPGNVLVDRSGTVKLLDLGLARIFHETTDDLTTGRDARTLLGTVDYLAPEQALNSHDVDIRADIYGLGATFYYILTGKGLFEDGTVAQKLSWHLHRPPVPISEARPDLPTGLIEVINTMLAKKPDDRYQTPEEVVEALEPWTTHPIPPPSPEELPQLSRAARASGPPSSVRMIVPSGKSLTSNPSRVSRPISQTTKILPTSPPTEEKAEVPSKPRKPEARLEPVPVPDPEPVVPLPVNTSAGSKAAKVVATPAGRSSWRQSKVAKILVASLLILGVGAGGWWWAFWGEGSKDASGTPPRKQPGLLVQASSLPLKTNVPVADTSPVPSANQVADALITLNSGSSPPHDYPSLKEAIKAAKRGDRIVVKGSLLIDAIELSESAGVPRDIAIEGVNPLRSGQPVRWRSPRDLSSGRALLDVSGIPGLTLKGFAFDGQGKVAELLRLSGPGTGSTLEDLQFSGATRASVVLRGWYAEPSRPATILRARFSTENEAEAAIAIEADPDRPSVALQSIQVVSCRFVGPFQSALLISGPVKGLDVELCRFFKANDGLRYRRTPIREPLSIRLKNNTFVDLERGLHFETTPPSASSEIFVTNNIFTGTPRLAMLDKVPVQPGRVAASWIWSDDTKKSPTVSPGPREFRKTFDLDTVPAKATLDISCDETFTVWLNGVELFKNPSPHYTQRVFSCDLAGKLQKGRNILAIQGTNRIDRLDPKFGTTAGLLAQISATVGARENVLVKTDETWKTTENASEGWTRPDFDDRSWGGTRRWPEEGAIWPWKFAVWDSVVLAQLKPPLEPITIQGSGNVRDYKSWEGYPTLDSERVVMENPFSKNPNDDPSFLYYPSSHPLATASPTNSPVGALEEK